jgi:DNA polymerase-3 subunit epsilon
VVVFTGSLSLVRSVATEFALGAGAEVGKGVTQKTTLLVVGEQDLRNQEGHKKSSKHRKAEALIEKGQSIRILSEKDFCALVSKPLSEGGSA